MQKMLFCKYCTTDYSILFSALLPCDAIFSFSIWQATLDSVVAAHEILSILRKTKTEMGVATMKSSSAEGFRASQSSGFFQSDSRYERKEQLRHVCNEGSTILDLDKQNGMMRKDNSEISKYEALNEVLSVEVSKSAKKGPETASSFFVGCVYTKFLYKLELVQCYRWHNRECLYTYIIPRNC